MKTIIGITRAEIYSPNSVERDYAIFSAVKKQLESFGYDVDEYPEGERLPIAGCYYTMGRNAATLDFLKKREHEGAVVINSAYGVESCRRSALNNTMLANGIPMAGREGDAGYWLKRGDGSAQSSEDVVFAADHSALDKAKEVFRRRGITSMVVSAHINGDLVKFYGVNGAGFFKCFYPGDDGVFKFKDEERNGIPHHYPFDGARLAGEAERLSSLVRTPVYGGDCIVEADGSFKIIDFNDWPSFSRCCDEAAQAIAGLINSKYGF